VQVASQACRRPVEQAGVMPGVSRPGNCTDNAAIENFWSSLKRERVQRCTFATSVEAGPPR